VVSFLSDYGLEDEFVGVVHRVIVAHAPQVAVVDLTHGIARHDIRAGALTLWRTAPWLVPGVILAVVDPGVGTARRAVALEVASAGALLVGPDNGLLLPAATSLGTLSAAVELHPRPIPTGRGATFAGRDLFAPAAARLAAGARLHSIGQPIDPASLAGEPIPGPQPNADGRLRCEVLWIDRFGNAQLNARPSDLDPVAAAFGPVVTLTAGHHRGPARRASTYAELGPGEVGLVTDSYGLLSVSCRGASAAVRLGLDTNSPVWLQPRTGG
jgi:S-adenosylmethionine hydrolase